MFCFNHISRSVLSVFLAVTLCFPVYGSTSKAPAISDVLEALHQCVFVLGVFGPESVKRSAHENATYAGIKGECQQLLSENMCQQQERCEWADDHCDLDEELVEIEVRLRAFTSSGWIFMALGALGMCIAGAGIPLLGVGIYLIYAGPTASQLKELKVRARERANATSAK